MGLGDSLGEPPPVKQFRPHQVHFLFIYFIQHHFFFNILFIQHANQVPGDTHTNQPPWPLLLPPSP